MQKSPIITIAAPASAELIEKKSRFIGQAFPVNSEPEAQEQLAKVKSQHRGARHNVYAWVIGANNEFMRSSDDGEPAGTGGRPVLETLKKSGLQNVMIVVTRYFGGILLGSGGLTRAYGKAAQLAIGAASVVKKIPAQKYAITCSYPYLSKTEIILDQPGIEIADKIYGEQIAIIAAISDQLFAKVQTNLTNLSNGTIRIDELGEQLFIDELCPQNTD